MSTPSPPPPPGELAPDDPTKKRRKRQRGPRGRHKGKGLPQQLAAEPEGRDYFMVNDPLAEKPTPERYMADGAAGNDQEEDGAVKAGGAGASGGRSEPVMMPAPNHPASDMANVSISTDDSQSNHQLLRLGQPVTAAVTAAAAAIAATDVAGSTTTPAAAGLPHFPAPDQLPPPGEVTPDGPTTSKKGRKSRRRRGRKGNGLSPQLTAGAAFRDYFMVNDPLAGSSTAGSCVAGGAVADTGTRDDQEEDGGSTTTPAAAGSPDFPRPDQLPPPDELAPDDPTTFRRGKRTRVRRSRKRKGLPLQPAAEAAFGDYFMANNPSAGSSTVGSSTAGGASTDTGTRERPGGEWRGTGWRDRGGRRGT